MCGSVFAVGAPLMFYFCKEFYEILCSVKMSVTYTDP